MALDGRDVVRKDVGLNQLCPLSLGAGKWKLTALKVLDNRPIGVAHDPGRDTIAPGPRSVSGVQIHGVSKESRGYGQDLRHSTSALAAWIAQGFAALSGASTMSRGSLSEVLDDPRFDGGNRCGCNMDQY